MPFNIIILVAVIQGLTEFLPVSSSGHLVLIPVITNLPYQGQTIDVAAHVGTLIAVLIYLRRDIFNIAADVFGQPNSAQPAFRHRLGLMIIGATIPVVLAGFVANYVMALADIVDNLAWANIAFAGLLWAADRFGGQLQG